MPVTAFNHKPQTTNYKPLSVLCCALILLASCANIVTPTGGPKDTQPPKVVEAVPANLSTRFTGNKITVTFDEYVKLDNPSQEIVISPAIEPEPKIQANRKRLEIEFKGAVLDSNTTYTFNFGMSLKDVNESNVLNNFQYVFSTGGAVDSLTVSGKVMSAKDDKPADKILVMLHRQWNDSALLTKKPFYFTRSGSDGSFYFTHIAHGKYRLYALKDENFNYIYDLPNEEIAFQESVLNVDSNLTGIRLNLFHEEREMPLKRIGLDDNRQGYIRLIYSKGVDTIAVNSAADGLSIAIPEYNNTRDTITAWYTRAVKDNRLRLIVNKDSVEEITAFNVPDDADSLKRMFSKFSLVTRDSLIAPQGIIAVTLNHPAMKAEFSRWVVQQDSLRTGVAPPKIKFTEGSLRRMELDFQRKPGTKYTIIFPAGMFTDYFGNTSDTLTLRVKTKTPEDYGSLKLSVTGQENQQYVMQMIEAKSSAIVNETAFGGTAILNFPQVMPASYELLIIYDANANGRWDTGNFLRHIQPEKTYRHPDKINVKANWEMEAELKIQ